MIYMIRAGECGPVKIGMAEHPQFRLSNLQGAHYEKLKILRLFEGDRKEELALHVRFAELHLRGEWFSYSKAMMGAVGLVEIVERAAPVALVPVPAQIASPAEVIEALGDTAAVAHYLKLPLPAVSNWKSRGIAKARLLDVHDLAINKGLTGITIDVLRTVSAPWRKQEQAE